MNRRSLLSLAASVGAGLVLRRQSLAFQSEPRIVQADLEAKAGWIPLAGRQAYRYGYNNQVPGPLIEARPGDTIRIRFTNSLPEATNLDFHGLHVPPTGVADNSFVMVAPGEQFQYELPLAANHPGGTFWIHPHMHGAVARQFRFLFSGSRPLYTRTSQVWRPRPTIWPTFRAIEIPPLSRGTPMAHIATLLN